MKVIDIRQRTPAWHAWRDAGVTASDVPVLLGSPYKTPWRLWAEKRGLLAPESLERNPHVRRGIWAEPLARQRFEERHGGLLLPICAESSEEPILRASFDGLTDTGEPVELKAPCETRFREAQALGRDAEAFRRHYAQVQAQLFVADADHGVLSLNYQGEALDFVIDRDPVCIGAIVDQARRFWECLHSGREPPLDPARDLFRPQGSARTAWERFAHAYRDLDRQCSRQQAELKQLQTRKSALEARFAALMGEFALADCAGVRVTRFNKRGAIDYKAALLDVQAVTDDALERYRRPPSSQVRVTVRDEPTSTAETVGTAVA